VRMSEISRVSELRSVTKIVPKAPWSLGRTFNLMLIFLESPAWEKGVVGAMLISR
jgi:hypothetical protein